VILLITSGRFAENIIAPNIKENYRMPIPAKVKRQGSVPRPPSKGEAAFALHCRAESLYPQREFLFHPSRKWRFDFAFEEAKLAVEVEGFGRHQRMGGFIEDCTKYNEAAKLGWKVLRYPTAAVLRGDAINDVLSVLGLKGD
jgi:very-short-patch-repair endonuclease